MKRKIRSMSFISQILLFGVNPDKQTFLQNEMLMDEKILWSGQPKQGFIFTGGDIFTIFIGLFWLGATSPFAYFAIQSFELFTMLFTLPFVLIGLYLVFGNIIYKNYQKNRTYYAVTNQRILIQLNLFNKKVKSKLISQIPVLNKTVNKDGSGTIQFDNTGYMGVGRDSYRIEMLSFDNIKDVDTVYKLISGLIAPHEVF
jgi:hypothetical protein